MIDIKTFRIITASAFSAIITAIFIVSITIGGELLPPLKSWLAETFYHHWVGKGILSVILFALAYIIAFAFSGAADEHSARRTLMTLFWVVLLGTISLYTFFLYESFAH